MEYPKINGLYKRYNKIEHPTLPEGKKYNDFIEGDFSCPEFEYLFNNDWIWSEKLDGTNIRIYLQLDIMSFCLNYQVKGRTDNADIPKELNTWIENWIEEKKNTIFEQFTKTNEVVFYGEGVGKKIQNGGAFGEQHFKLFDIYIGGMWLEKRAVNLIGSNLGLDVPPYWVGTIPEAIEKVKTLPKSHFGDFTIEGYVGQPLHRIRDAQGRRISTKIKVKDFVK
jgi:hypothetical protein